MAEQVVHVLKSGQTLCRMPGLPKDWPDGHRWVAYNDAELIGEVNCLDCLAKKTKEGTDVQVRS